MAENQTVSVQLYGNSPEPIVGQMQIERWTNHEANARARKKLFKFLGMLCIFTPVCLFVHVLVIPTALAWFTAFVGSFPAYMYWSEERLTCLGVEADCPYCHKRAKLAPYPSARYKDPMTVQCSSCGQTCKAYPAEAITAAATQ